MRSFSWFRGCPILVPVSTSHTWPVLSAQAVTTRRPSGLKEAHVILSPCFKGAETGLPVEASHSFASVLLTVIIRLPFGPHFAIVHRVGVRKGG